MSSDDVTPFFDAQDRGRSTTNSTHTSVVPIPVDNGVRYVRIDAPSVGWVGTRNAASKIVSLCEYTKVKLLKNQGGRVYFRLLDGNSVEVGQELSIIEAGAVQHFRKDKREGGVKIEVINFKMEERVCSIPRGNQELVQRSGELEYAGQRIPVTLETCRYFPSKPPEWEYSPLPVGTYKLLSPDYPHDYTKPYRKEPKGHFDMVWFPIEYGNNSRYLHMGHYSEGCVTLTNIIEWEKLYHDLIRCRSDGNDKDQPGGGKYIGEIAVIEKAVHKPPSSSPRKLTSY
jgi:hypothetical protein